MKKLLLIFSFLCFALISVAYATSVDKTIKARQAQVSQMQQMIKQREQDALNRKAFSNQKKATQKSVPERRKVQKNIQKQTEQKKEKKQIVQPSDKTDLLHITGPGDFAGPLTQQQLVQDGSSGLAYQKPTYPPKETEIQTQTQENQTRRLKPVEKEYTLSGSTFDVDLQKDTQSTSFQIQTMERIANEVKKDNVQFVECQPGDKNCADYKVDNTGKVIW